VTGVQTCSLTISRSRSLPLADASVNLRKLLGIDPLLFDRFRHDLLIDLAFLGEGVEGADDDRGSVDFEEAAQVFALVAASLTSRKLAPIMLSAMLVVCR